MIGHFPFPPLAKGAGGILKSTLSETHAIPALGGTYALWLSCPRSADIRIGALGAHAIPRGWYAYVGSAFGPGGLRARCRHHLRPLRRRHWHIDHLRPAAAVRAIWFTSDPVPREHLWAAVLRKMKNAAMPVPGFGSSDCGCPTHLVHFSTRPSLPIFQREILGRMPGHAAITAFSAGTPRQPRRNAL